MDILGSGAMQAARTALDGLARRHEAISSNIANIDTPGYQRRAVDFEQALASEMGTAAGGLHLNSTNARHLQPGMHGNVSALGGGGPSREAVSERNDANSVSIDEEMTNLAETQIRFQALSQTVGQRISTLRAVIRGQ
jgi:flagellar basal-body rod protein FlgB